MEVHIIQKRIHEVRGRKVMLDFDLAELYQTSTKRVNEQVKRNLAKFPDDFMFRLTVEEWAELMRSQVATASQTRRNTYNTPYAFTEHGIAMLACVLKSEKAIQMNIFIIRAFIALRELALSYTGLVEQIDEIRQTVEGHSQQLQQIYRVIEGMVDGRAALKKQWDERERIGFKK